MAFARLVRDKRWWPDTKAVVGAPAREFMVVSLALAAGVFGLAAITTTSDPGPVISALFSFIASAIVAWLALNRTYPHDHLGLCNVITLGRLALATTLVAPLLAGNGTSWIVFVVAAIALTLDGIDGWVARRQRYVSRFGARFDLEVDSLFALVLALSAAVSSGVGPIAIMLGLPRYLFAAAARWLPWIQHDLPERFTRKAVCAVQLVVLVALQVPILPVGLALALVPLGAAALFWSFAVDVAWLWRRRA